MTKNIALIGFMATGKSAIGRKLAIKLDYKFVETDELIEKLAGKKIPEIFKDDGEPAFREYEIAVIKGIAESNNTIISCGGGVILNKINIDRLKQSGTVILLTAKPETILQRTKDDTSRPLLNIDNEEGKLNKIKEMLTQREFYYTTSADITVATDGKSHEKVIEEIIHLLQKI
jgi:shikimate kinase